MSGRELENNNTFDNRLFWNQRYTENPSLGSGVGSRGLNLLHKQRIISEFLESTMPESILDIGCGDYEVLKNVVFKASYTGIDISNIIIEENKRKFPSKSFLCNDFVTCAIPERFMSDVVFCFEVLIHQHGVGLYRKLVSNLVSATRKAGLVSGYVANPRPLLQSPIIAWHEPIVDTLRAVGAHDVRIVSTSLESECLAFVSYTVQ